MRVAFRVGAPVSNVPGPDLPHPLLCPTTFLSDAAQVGSASVWPSFRGALPGSVQCLRPDKVCVQRDSKSRERTTVKAMVVFNTERTVPRLILRNGPYAGPKHSRAIACSRFWGKTTAGEAVISWLDVKLFPLARLAPV